MASRLRACINIWECTADGVSRVSLFDWTAGFNSQFNADDLIQWLGQGDDLRTLSILANGTLFLHPDADTPPLHHVRLMPNQSSYGEVIETMGDEIAGMALGRKLLSRDCPILLPIYPHPCFLGVV